MSLRAFGKVRDTWHRGYTRRGPQRLNLAQHDIQQRTRTSRTVNTSLSNFRNAKTALSTPGISFGPSQTRIHLWLPYQRPTCILLVDRRRAVLRGRARLYSRDIRVDVWECRLMLAVGPSWDTRPVASILPKIGAQIRLLLFKAVLSIL
jgi:hypothetical protein